MSGEVKIEIRQEIDPSFMDWLCGTMWYWTVSQQNILTYWRYKSGFARTEKQARRRAERAAHRIMEGTIRYEYNPAGLTPGRTGK